jgi:hypothetical protein
MNFVIPNGSIVVRFLDLGNAPTRRWLGITQLCEIELENNFTCSSRLDLCKSRNQSFLTMEVVVV